MEDPKAIKLNKTSFFIYSFFLHKLKDTEKSEKKLYLLRYKIELHFESSNKYVILQINIYLKEGKNEIRVPEIH